MATSFNNSFRCSELRNTSLPLPVRNLSDSVRVRNATRNPCNVFPARNPPTSNVPCYSCHTSCVYKSLELIFVLGIIANVLVVVRVMRDRKLRQPTFVTIACLALADGLLLTSNMFLAVEIVVRALTCTMVPIRDFIFQSPVALTIYAIPWFCSNMHLAFMAVVRYIIIAHPLKSMVYLTNKRILIVSACLWIFSSVVFVLKHVIEHVTGKSSVKSAEAVSVMWMCVYLFPLIVTSVLHAVKLRRLKKHSKTVARSASLYTKTSIRRMSKMIVAVIFLAAVLPLPRFIYKILERLHYEYPSNDIRSHFHNIAVLLYLLNYALNPFIYGFMSPPFRKSLKAMCKRQSGRNNSSTVLSSEKSSRHSGVLTDFNAVCDSPEVSRSKTVHGHEGNSDFIQM